MTEFARIMREITRAMGKPW